VAQDRLEKLGKTKEEKLGGTKTSLRGGILTTAYREEDIIQIRLFVAIVSNREGRQQLERLFGYQRRPFVRKTKANSHRISFQRSVAVGREEKRGGGCYNREGA